MCVADGMAFVDDVVRAFDERLAPGWSRSSHTPGPVGIIVFMPERKSGMLVDEPVELDANRVQHKMNLPGRR
jgi:hypothetical protein